MMEINASFTGWFDYASETRVVAMTKMDVDFLDRYAQNMGRSANAN